jgi:hypothetical protein
MEDILKTLPRWIVLIGIVYVAGLLTYAVYDNRTVEFFPPKIHERAASSGPGGLPWVSIDRVTPKFPMADCVNRGPGVLAMGAATNVKRAQWGDAGLWFAELHGNTVWLSCQPAFVIVGAAGSAPDGTKRAVDVLIDVLSR